MRMSDMIADEKALEGKWKRVRDFEDLRVLAVSSDCNEADVYSQNLYRRILGRRALRSGKRVPPAVRDYVNCMTLIHVCIKDWRNWRDDKGEQVPFSKAALEGFLLKETENGIEAKDASGRVRIYPTDDNKAYNFRGKFLYDSLMHLVNTIDERDEDDPDDGAAESGDLDKDDPGIDDPGGRDAAKNASPPGSAPDTATGPRPAR